MRGGGGEGGGGSDTTTIEPPPALVAGVLLGQGIQRRAEVGQALRTELGLQPIDPANTIRSVAAVNPNASGAPATITLAGELAWTPNAADAATDRLDVHVMDGLGRLTTLALPVRVYTPRTVFEATLTPDSSTYSDAEGAYVVGAFSTDATPLAGKVTVTELRHRDGGRSIKVSASAPQVVPTLLAHPKGAALVASGFTTQAEVKPMAPGMVYQDFPFGLAMGSVDRFGFNLYTTREEVYSFTTPIDGVESTYSAANLEQVRVMQVDSTCRSHTDCRNRDGAPIVLIHGFTPETEAFDIGGIGGGEGTWGNLVNELNSSTDNARRHHVFELRWLTHLRFEEAAGRLAHLLRKVKALTGRKPIIVAHSFGGIVAHLALSGQGIVWVDGAWAEQSTDGLVERLITLGSPVSGINKTAGNLVTFGGQATTFVVGRDSNDFTIGNCRSIACVQAGAFDVMPQLAARSGSISWHDSLWEIDRNIDRNNPVGEMEVRRADKAAGTLYVRHGETIHRLLTRQHTVPTYAFVGVSGLDGVSVMVRDALRSYPTDINLVRTDPSNAGDMLIAVRGQIHPADQTSLGLTAAMLRAAVQQEPATVSGKQVYPTYRVATSGSRTYFFVPNMRHTQALHTASIFGAPNAPAEPYVPAGGLVSYCPGQHWVRASGEMVCVSSARPRLMHPLLAQNLPGGLLDIPTPTLLPPTTWTRTFTITTNCPPPRLCTQAEDPVVGIPISVEVRRRDGGERVYVSRLYTTDAAGSAEVDLDSLVGDLPASLRRADLFGRVTVGDAVTYEMKTVVIDDLTADTAAPIAISLQRFASSGTGSIGGSVVDRAGRPIANAIVTLRAGVNLGAGDFGSEPASFTARSITTDANGAFIVSGLRATEFTARVRGATFLQTFVPGLTITSGGTLNRNMVVQATSCPTGFTLSDGGCQPVVVAPGDVVLSESGGWGLEMRIVSVLEPGGVGRFNFSAFSCGGTLRYAGILSATGEHVFQEDHEYGTCVKDCMVHVAADLRGYREVCPSPPFSGTASHTGSFGAHGRTATELVAAVRRAEGTTGFGLTESVVDGVWLYPPLSGADFKTGAPSLASAPWSIGLRTGITDYDGVRVHFQVPSECRALEITFGTRDAGYPTWVAPAMYFRDMTMSTSPTRSGTPLLTPAGSYMLALRRLSGTSMGWTLYDNERGLLLDSGRMESGGLASDALNGSINLQGYRGSCFVRGVRITDWSDATWF